MRVMRLLPFTFVLLLPVSVVAQTPGLPVPDSEAVVIVQAAIAAFGGTTAMTQTHVWSFEAQLDGMEKGTQTDTFDTNAKAASAERPSGTITTSGAFPSPLLPAFAGALLLKESSDPNFAIRYQGQTTVGSRTLVIVDVWLARNPFRPAQTWYFDKATGLPALIDFRLPARIGHFRSVRGLVELSNYRSVSGVLYPFKIVTTVPGQPLPHVVTLQSVTAGGVQ